MESLLEFMVALVNMANHAPTPIQSSIPLDLERRISELHVEYSSHTGPPGDLNDNRIRWLVVGICVHSILSPALRKYVDPVVTNLYSSLKITDQIDLQTPTIHLRIYGAANIYLNYEAINSNKTAHGYRTVLWDYNVQNAVDLSKLFLQTHMTHYTAFDESCDSSALLGMIDKIDKFPGNVQIAARTVRSDIRNPWAHCNFTEWDTMKYTSSLQRIEDFIYLLNLNAAEESQFIREINKWRINEFAALTQTSESPVSAHKVDEPRVCQRTSRSFSKKISSEGTSFFQGTTIGLELVDEIRQQIQILVEYADVICKSGDGEFSRVHTELREIGDTLSQNDKRISTLENTVARQGKALFEYGSLYDADMPEIEQWKQKRKLFVETDVFTDVLWILESQHCLLLTGVSGMGKTLTAQNIALKLSEEKEYIIEPCISIKDIKRRYKQNVPQVFFVDDMCGKYAANINDIENWLKMVEFIKCILVKGKTKILATCRTEVFNEESFQEAFDLFKNVFYEFTVTYSLQDKIKIASKYLKKDENILLDILGNVEFSPIMCFLYSQHDTFEINEFLNSPYKTFQREWNQLKSFDKVKFCVLLLCVIYNGIINEAIFDVSNDLDIIERKKLKHIFEYCKLCRDTSRSTIKEKLHACVDTYFIKVDREFKVIHDKMFDFLCCYFGKTLLAPILKYANDKLICERVQLQSIESIRKTNGEFTIRISLTDEQKYVDRLRCDLVNGKIHWCLNNGQMKHKEYREKFLDVVKDLDDDIQGRLIDIKDENGVNSFVVSCLRGYEELIGYFISIGTDVNARNGWFTPLTAACRDGHLKTVDILLDNGAMVNQTNKFGETPLYTACICGHFCLVKRLIEERCDINVRDKCNHTLLCVSCLGGYKKIATLLIDEGAKVFECCNLLINATYGGNNDLVESFITKGWDVNSVDLHGRTALFIACEEGFLKIVILLIDKNADIFKVNDNGETPLHAACLTGNIDIVRTLIENNADINMLDNDRETPLHKACRKGSTSIIRTLLTQGADIKQRNAYGIIPFDLAKQQHDIMDVIMLKSTEQIGPSKWSTNTSNEINKFEGQHTTKFLIRHGWTPLYEACMHGDFKTVKSLIREGANVGMKTTSGETPLVAACQQGHGFVIQLLIDKGADICNALLIAVKNDYDRTVKILSYKGGDLSYQTDDGKSLLTLAFEQGSIKVITFMLQKGLHVERVCNSHHLPLCIACTTGYDKTVKLLIEQGANCNDRCIKDGKTPLWSACTLGYNKIVEILIDKGADIYEMDEIGKTLLHVAHNFNVFQLLIDIGLDSNKQDNYGRYPLYESMVSGIDEISYYLIQTCFPIATSEEDKKTAIISVFESGNTKLSRLVVSKGYTNDIMTFSKTILYHMYRLGLFENVKIMLKHEDVFNNIYKYGYSPAILADIAGNDHLAEYLLTQDCNHNSLRSFPFFPENEELVYITERDNHTGIMTEDTCDECEYLFQACMTGEAQSWQRYIDGRPFVRRKINLFFKSKEQNGAIWFKQTPLCLASRKGHIKVVRLLLEYGAQVDKFSNDIILDNDYSGTYRIGYTPLFTACQRKYYEIVDLLLENGANLNISLNDACREGYLDTVQFLVKKGADVNSVDPCVQTALYSACAGGYTTIVKYLIDQGAHIDTRVVSTKFSSVDVETNMSVCISSKSETCLNVVYACGNLKVLQLLLERGSSVEAFRFLKTTLFYTACIEGTYKFVEKIIDKGIDINASNILGATPLLACVIHLSTKKPMEEGGNTNSMINYHNDNESNFNNSDVESHSYKLAHIGIQFENLIKNHFKVIQLLIENGANTNQADKTGRTPLSVAREMRNYNLIKMLKKSCFKKKA